MKKQIREDFHVYVYPRWWGWESEKQHIDECERMAKEIRRHVDGVGSAQVCWTTRYVCSYCGYEWEEDEDGVPVCCQAAIDEFEKGGDR